MAVYRPYEVKRRIRDAIECNYWHGDPDNYITREERAVLERIWTHMRIVYPWSEEKRH